MAVPSFTQAVPDNGYQWWYLDAISDDGAHALTVIIFIGSVFSPYYAWARKRGPAKAAQHCSINVALYGKPSRWSMTERTENSMQADAGSLSIGNSQIRIEGNMIAVDINEVSVPVPKRLTGTLKIVLPEFDLNPHPLDQEDSSKAQHFWQPIAPHTRIEVDMSSPKLQWAGNAYVDSNYGNAPLESSFRSWTWSRSHSDNGDTTVLYDVLTRDGRVAERSLKFTRAGKLTTVQVAEERKLAPTRYFRINRTARTCKSVQIESLQTLEDTPFYARSRFTEVIKCTQSPGNGTEREGSGRMTTVHESLDLDRFDSAWVRCLLPFRMPRRTRTVLLR